jgi:hypothetical protein
MRKMSCTVSLNCNQKCLTNFRLKSHSIHACMRVSIFIEIRYDDDGYRGYEQLHVCVVPLAGASENIKL